MLDAFWIILFLMLIVGLPYTYSRKGIKFCIGIAYIIGVVVFARLFYVFKGINSVLSSLVFSAQLFTFGINAPELIEILDEVKDSLSSPYICCVWAAYLICPVLTVSVLLTYIKKGLDRTTLKMKFFKEIYIFTEKNDNALILAEDICNNTKRSVVVFANTDGEDMGPRLLCVSYSAMQVAAFINSTNNVYACFNDTDTGKNLDNLNEFLHRKKKKQEKIYVFLDNPVAQEVVDGMKKNVHDEIIRIVSTKAILMREILWDYPLFSNMHTPGELNVSVFGIGDFGGSFAANTLWCSVIPDCHLKLNLVDAKTEESILTQVSENIPKGYFDIEIYNEDINTNAFFEKIGKTRLKDSDYILVSMGNDDLNISISRKIRLYFARCGKNPFIMTVVKNQSKFSVMRETLKKEGIVVTGGAENIYSYKSIFKDRFFARAFEVYKIVENNYGNNPSEDDFFRQNQIDILSSYANAIHCKYKVFALTGTTDVSEAQIKAQLEKKHDKIVSAEHERWVVFEILKGYVGVPKENLIEFLESNKSTRKIHKNEILKMHACITDISGVEEAERMIKEISGKEQKLVEIDELIAEQTAKIWFIE